MKIAIDIDDVLADFTSSFKQYCMDAGFSLKDDCDSYFLWDMLNVSPEETLEIVYSFYKSPTFRNLKVVKGAKEAVNFFVDSNDLCIITSRPKDLSGEVSENWLQKNFPGIFKKIFYTDCFYSKHEKNPEKFEVCLKESIDLIIEDAAHFAEKCARAGKQVFLMDRIWNRGLEEIPGLQRVLDWEDAIEKFKQLRRDKNN